MWYFIIMGVGALITVGSFILGALLLADYKRDPKSYLDDDAKKVFLGLKYGIPIIALLAGGVLTAFKSIYTQDPGNASVLVSFTGAVDSIDYATGLRIKAPWTRRVTYDIRNNTLSYVGQSGSTDSYTGGDVSGPQITFQDANNVSGNIDVTIRYSIRGEAVENIYNEFKTQEEFVNATLAPDVRATVREVLSHFDTSEVYGSRDAVKAALTKQLGENWDTLGVNIEEVYLQEVRYPDSVVNAFASVQTAQAGVERAKAEQEQARVEAETNNIKSAALSDAILQEKLIDAIKNGNGTYIINTDNIAVTAK